MSMHDDTAHDQLPTAVNDSASTRAPSQSRARVKSNLSAEQLRQKRIVDRRAQQAFRDRNKENVRRLEQELDELRAKWQTRENQLLQETQHLREQNETLLQRLHSIASIATTAADIHHAFLNARRQGEKVVDDAPGETFSANSPDLTGQTRPNDPLLQSERNALPASVLHDEIVTLPADRGTAARSGSPLASDVTVPFLHSRSVASDPEPTISRHPQILDEHITSLKINTAPVTPAQIDAPARASRLRNPVELVSAILPVHLPATCPLDHILLGCLQTSQTALSDGASPKFVTGPQKASVRGFLEVQPNSSVHSISKVMCEVMLTFPSVGKAEQLALFYLMHRTMRWMVVPEQKSYESMPEWLRPTVTQITVPHAAWIDNVPWPGVRDRIITYPHDYPYHLWTANFTQAVEIHWPHELSDACIESDGDTVLHSIFEKHICELKHWSVSPQFGKVFPDLMPIMLPNYPAGMT
ncbi:hypothetical protein D6D01_04260 [Aureobasidium pullulans]|uniref:BZIP domain-containing protein n=1 Tax=Aureobasidium pullulans TaxID=5580 RepID=A0A4S9LCB0_AURPU|nr:hypothetical protein D6D01_04260 [Aureobasidium pullulans]